jgi:hypothetical protein
MTYDDGRCQVAFIAKTGCDRGIDVTTIRSLSDVCIDGERKLVKSYAYDYTLTPDFVQAITCLPEWGVQWETKLLDDSPRELDNCVIRPCPDGALRLVVSPHDHGSKHLVLLEAMISPLIPLMQERRLIITVHVTKSMNFTLGKNALHAERQPGIGAMDVSS